MSDRSLFDFLSNHCNVSGDSMTEEDLGEIREVLKDDLECFLKLQAKMMSNVSRILVGKDWPKMTDSSEEKKEFIQLMEKWDDDNSGGFSFLPVYDNMRRIDLIALGDNLYQVKGRRIVLRKRDDPESSFCVVGRVDGHPLTDEDENFCTSFGFLPQNNVQGSTSSLPIVSVPGRIPIVHIPGLDPLITSFNNAVASIPSDPIVINTSSSVIPSINLPEKK